MKFNFSDADLFQWDELFYIEWETDIGFDALKTLVSNLEDSLETTKKKFDDLIKNDPDYNFLYDQDKGSYYSQLFEREEITIGELQIQQRYSICLSLFSYFEGRLKFICNQIENKFNFQIKVTDLSNNKDCWNYLKNDCKIETAKVNPFFTHITQQKIVRDIIAHQGGLASEQRSKKICIVTGLKLREVGNAYQIQIIDKSYSLYLIEKMTTFFKELLLAIDKRCKEITLV